jgi:putative tryptophan/tyrosine transport system substrate-binding protein
MFDMRRREFITLLGGATAQSLVRPITVLAQTAPKMFRIGHINSAPQLVLTSPLGKVLEKSFQQRGYTLGKNLALELRGAAGQIDTLPGLVQELVDAKVDLILATGYPPAVLAKLTGLPTVVTHGAGDPVATKLVQSWSRPGGNVTGISDNAAELSTKRLQLLKETVPAIRRVAMLWNKEDLAMTLRYDAAAIAAQGLGVSVQPLGVREPNDFDEAFGAMTRDKPDAILMVADALTILNRKRVYEFAAAYRLPAIYELDFLVVDGGLMSYGPDLAECFERAVALADRILKGAKPGELPFEQPTRYKFVINAKTAKALGIEIPQTVMARADKVIE